MVCSIELLLYGWGSLFRSRPESDKGESTKRHTNLEQKSAGPKPDMQKINPFSKTSFWGCEMLQLFEQTTADW